MRGEYNTGMHDTPCLLLCRRSPAPPLHSWADATLSSLAAPSRLALDWGLLACQGKTPEATMASALYGDIKRKGGPSLFIRCALRAMLRRAGACARGKATFFHSIAGVCPHNKDSLYGLLNSM